MIVRPDFYAVEYNPELHRPPVKEPTIDEIDVIRFILSDSFLYIKGGDSPDVVPPEFGGGEPANLSDAPIGDGGGHGNVLTYR